MRDEHSGNFDPAKDAGSTSVAIRIQSAPPTEPQDAPANVQNQHCISPQSWTISEKVKKKHENIMCIESCRPDPPVKYERVGIFTSCVLGTPIMLTLHEAQISKLTLMWTIILRISGHKYSWARYYDVITFHWSVERRVWPTRLRCSGVKHTWGKNEILRAYIVYAHDSRASTLTENITKLDYSRYGAKSQATH